MLTVTELVAEAELSLGAWQPNLLLMAFHSQERQGICPDPSLGHLLGLCEFIQKPALVINRDSFSNHATQQTGPQEMRKDSFKKQSLEIPWRSSD